MPRRRPAAGNGSRKTPGAPPGRLRIVAGNWRSRVLEVAAVEGLRPTPARVRETLFNWLGPGIAGKRCLDLYAGTGALGFEALSRGAGEALFVEKSARAAAMIRDNVERLQATGARVLEGDAHAWLRGYASIPFDVVFLDPPFAHADIGELCRLLAAAGAVAPGGRVYFEQDRQRPLPELPRGWSLLRQKTAGNVRYGLLAAASAQQERE